ncbi:MAG: tetratricopeptide repeat protein [Deltaproteobacteria bacterium]|nr:tetratricopeptide repeat protein [Deltaproteobacteria bacterium]
MSSAPDSRTGSLSKGERRFARLLVPAALLVGAALPLGLVFHARAANGVHGFPLDDPWIHLTYARTLHQHRSFAYFPGDPATAGSTAPLYTLLLAAGFGATSDEKLLSYALGIAFHLGFLILFARWASRSLGSAAWALGALLLVALDRRVGILTVSGMETSLFLLLVAWAFCARQAPRGWSWGLAVGLAVWVRPDGLVLALGFGLRDLFAWLRRPADTVFDARSRLLPWVPLSLLVIGYGLFNFSLGRELLPNTFAAKTALYAAKSRGEFVTGQLQSFLLGHGWLLLMPFALVAGAVTGGQLLGRREAPLADEAAFGLGLPLAYLALLPFAHRFERYLVPALPALAILSLGGLRQALAWVRRRAPALAGRALPVSLGAVLVVACVLHAQGVALAVTEYRYYCHYHYQRHERTGRWIAAHTPPGAVVAAHDVGAVGYYSQRRIVDLAGLVSPEIVRHMGKPDYFEQLHRIFGREKVTHLALLRSWLELDNVEPLFVAHPVPEVMEVYAWAPPRAHLVPPHVTAERNLAAYELSSGRVAVGHERLKRLAREDPQSARTWMLLAEASLRRGDRPAGRKALDRVLRLNPDHPVARAWVARLARGAT